MTRAARLLHRLRAAARRRVRHGVLLTAMPLAAGSIVLAAQRIGPAAAWLAAMTGAVVVVVLSQAATRRVDLRWVARRLDAAMPELEDSSALLFDAGAMTRLQRLQCARVGARLEAGPLPDLRPPLPWGGIAAAWLLAAGLVLAGWWPPAGQSAATRAGGTDAGEGTATEGATRLVASRLTVEPPAYTGLSGHTDTSLDAQAPVGARLSWRLRLAPQPEAVHLATHDGRRIALRAEGEEWIGEHLLEASLLYRIVVEAGDPADATLHRLDAVDDQPPQVRVIEPEQNIVLAEPGQQQWSLLFEASDDYGLGEASLVLTLAQGGGENVAFSERLQAVQGEGDARSRRYALDIDLVELGLGSGDDVVARLQVDDNHEPQPQTGRSPAVLLRWPPPPTGEASGFDGLVQRTLPAYFRSQRQIIIDTEALIAQRMRLQNDEFVARSSAIGADQALLRLRYGQFMGEEAEGGVPGAGHDHGGGHDHAHHGHEHDHDDHSGHGHHVPDAPAAGRAQTRAEATARTGAPAALFADEAAHEAARDDTPEQGAPGNTAGAEAVFGDEAEVVARYGHIHDQAEAATLLDPQTREILRGALGAMWQAERHLRQGEPVSALPHENRALELIKQVQQANRIYLARVGLELPPIDESRRLSGDVDGVSDRPDPLAPAGTAHAPLLALWAALEDGHSPGQLRAAAERAAAWIAEDEEKLEDPLALLAALDTLQRDPECLPCREPLRVALWAALPVPAAGVASRPRLDPGAAAYLDALHGPPQ